MNLTKLRAVWLSCLSVAVVIVWAFTIHMAVTVSTVVLKTLEQIVNLAALG